MRTLRPQHRKGGQGKTKDAGGIEMNGESKGAASEENNINSNAQEKIIWSTSSVLGIRSSGKKQTRGEGNKKKGGIVEEHPDKFLEETICWYADDANNVQQITLKQLREMYHANVWDPDRLEETTQVSFGAEWCELNKWLGQRNMKVAGVANPMLATRSRSAVPAELKLTSTTEPTPTPFPNKEQILAPPTDLIGQFNFSPQQTTNYRKNRRRSQSR